MSKPILYYFPGRGRAEIARLLFVHAGIDYEDKRTNLAEVGDKAPLKQLPILEDNGKIIFQSRAIARYVAKKAGLFGSDDMEAAHIDAVTDTTVDIALGFLNGTDEAKAKFNETGYPKIMNGLEKLLTQNGTGFFVGNKITLADISFFDVFWTLTQKNSTLLDAYPHAKKNYETVASDPKIKDWVEKRPQSNF
eukprot:TRINITY_DN526_c0_g1_i1.p1 TRINITY_DN526_c0_g1~~TRINITY_DN526_c0_g1_i1.p1  ORF type:complete len:193 (+),score=60.50 TRINITY_DN526_c0_g1_i1:49-627(+)